jgi:Resolvase, N terminal domain
VRIGAGLKASEAIDFIKHSKGKVTHLVVQDTTGFSRNDEVRVVACAVLKKLGVRLISVDEPMLDDSPSGKLTGTILAALGGFYSDSLSSRVRYRFQIYRIPRQIPNHNSLPKNHPQASFRGSVVSTHLRIPIVVPRGSQQPPEGIPREVNSSATDILRIFQTTRCIHMEQIHSAAWANKH